jgi:signal transduction histidine kinase
VVRTFDGPDSKVFIEVEDNGEGIADEHRHRIFKPFFSTKPQGEHTGLGLTISQDLLARMAGRLTFETIAGKGTVFRIELPAEPDEAMQPLQRPAIRRTDAPTEDERAPARQR